MDECQLDTDTLFSEPPGSPAPNVKSRTIALEFDVVEPGTEEQFLRTLVRDISRARAKMVGGIGFLVKHASYFVHKGKFWVILISKDSLLLAKWDFVFTGIGARSMRLNRTCATSCGATRNSLFGVLQMFAGETTMAELVRNRLDFDVDSVIARVWGDVSGRPVLTPFAG